MSKQLKPRACCKVCKDAGKCEEEYTSHFVRASPDPNAPITCPLLLSLECRFCHKNGHTVNYCKERSLVKKREDKRERSYNFNFTIVKENIPIKKSTKNKRFQAICESETDSDNEKEIIKKQNAKKLNESFPQLNPEAMKVLDQKKSNAKSFIEIINGSSEEPTEKIEHATWLSTLKEFKSKKTNVAQVVLPIIIPPSSIPKKRPNWADMLSSEDEDEAEYKYKNEYKNEYKNAYDDEEQYQELDDDMDR